MDDSAKVWIMFRACIFEILSFYIPFYSPWSLLCQITTININLLSLQILIYVLAYINEVRISYITNNLEGSGPWEPQIPYYVLYIYNNNIYIFFLSKLWIKAPIKWLNVNIIFYFI